MVWKIGDVWLQNFRVEKEQVETTGALNKILLENILPVHVADHFLHSPRGKTEVRRYFLSYFCVQCVLCCLHFQELYHESYDNVCVMFASIPNFWEYFEQASVSRHKVECIRILNELICDFDQVRGQTTVK